MGCSEVPFFEECFKAPSVRDGQDLLDSIEKVFSGSPSWSYRIFYFRQGLPVDIIRNPVVETIMWPPCAVPIKKLHKLLFRMTD